jgi:hypothetical protein
VSVGVQVTTIPTEGKSAVVDMRWDGLSPFYLLVAYKSGALLGRAK